MYGQLKINDAERFFPDFLDADELEALGADAQLSLEDAMRVIAGFRLKIAARQTRA
ncbi:hypothetical protein [Geoalkalibacter sp.]|uniref:hypothetical protein n=1 Tax=Geoalkalibacter sp. TaxID=3041440 RepID=UPI00272E4846|nr:hypothetical protein [Geoalkalibacter sp.]